MPAFFDDGIVLVTGGTSGIGLATAIAFASAGAAHVVVCGRDPQKWLRAKRIIAATGTREGVIEYVCADVRVESNVEALVRYVYDRYGVLHACVNNAGVYPVGRADIADITLDSYVREDGSIAYVIPPPQPLTGRSDASSSGPHPVDHVAGDGGGDIEAQYVCPPDAYTPTSRYCENPLATIAIGTLYCLKHEIRAARQWQPQGIPLSIVNTASRNAVLPEEGAILYDVSKSVVVALTRAVAGQVAARAHSGEAPPLKIRVNSVAPGPIQTPLLEAQGAQGIHDAVNDVPLGRVGLPSEVAQAILFLSDERRASYITGANLAVDGASAAMPHF